MYKVLIVEDNPIQIETLLTFIDWKSVGVTKIITSKNGEDGEKKFYEFLPDIIITDICMPRSDGLKMVASIREKNKNVQVIFISAYNNFEYAQNAVGLDVCSYLLKPFTPSQLLDSINHAIEKISRTKNLDAFEKKYSEALLTYREMFLHLLSNNAFSYTKNLVEIKENFFFENYKSFILIKISFTDDNNKNSFDNSLVILNKFKEKLFKNYSGTGILEEHNSILFLLYSTSDEEDPFSDLTSLLENVQNEISDLQEKIEISLSETFYDITKIQKMYFQTKVTLENRYVPVGNNIFAYDELEENTSFTSINELKARLEEISKNPDSQSIDKVINDFYPEKINNLINLKIVCFTFIAVVQFILIEYNMDINSILGADVWDKIKNINTVQNPRQWIKNILLTFYECINENSQNKYQKMVNDIKNYINENFSQIRNIDQIAPSLYISTSYAKQIFKQYTGQSIFEYLTLTRINAAKELFSDPYMKVYEVCEKVGYRKVAHFSELFKRYTGKTPQQYQKMQRS